MISFSEAIYLVKKGKRVARTAWSGSGVYLLLVEEMQSNIGPNKRFIVMETAGDQAIHWYPGQDDMLTDDWVLV